MKESGRMHLEQLLCLADRYYLTRYVLSVGSVIGGFGEKTEQWCLDRSREVQKESNNILDIWSRGAWKSTLKTFAGTIQDILRDPEITIGIFSHTRNIAYGFSNQVMRELETNPKLKRLFGNILWDNPSNDSPLWTKMAGYTVKRQGNPKEATVEAWGLLDSQPSGRHFRKRRYDDVISPNEVTTAEMMQKLVEAWELSLNLGTEGGEAEYTGTFYSNGDPYHEMLRRGAVRLRWHPPFSPEDSNIRVFVNNNGEVSKEKIDSEKPERAAVDLVENCESPIFSREFLRDKGPGTRNFAIQVLCDPTASGTAFFKEEWLQEYRTEPWHERSGKNVIILVDPASRKPDKQNPDPDYTTAWVVALGADHNYYVLDAVRDRLNLEQRINKLFELHALWTPYEVRYEEYGFAVDVEAIKLAQEMRGYRFNIVPVPKKGAGVVRVAKEDRIERLQPLFQAKRIFFPGELKYRTAEGQVVDLKRTFVEEEYKRYAGRLSTRHDDMLDALARLEEPECPLLWPQGTDYWHKALSNRDPYAVQEETMGSWLSA